MKRKMRMILTAAGALLVLLFAVDCNGGGGTAPVPPAPSGATFVGATTCGTGSGCHADIQGQWQTTAHSKALQALQQIGQDKNTACLPCHTVGFGTATGFKDATSTANLAGVQCESCHGAGSDHVASGNGDKTKITTFPNILSADVCGKCHTGNFHPTVDEWKTSKHVEVTPHVAAYFADQTRGPTITPMCGPCHSGDFKTRVIENGEPAANVDLRGLTPDQMTPVTCPVCHDPHTVTGNNAVAGTEYQLRHKEFVDPTTDPYGGGDPTTIAVYSKVNHECGQCHNRRGADPSDTGLQANTSRPPHHAVQMDFMFGIGGVQTGTPPAQSAHRNNEKQCATCHMYAKPAASETDTGITGHEFAVHLEACSPCHSASDAAARMLATKSDIEARLFALQTRLNNWGTTANIDTKGPLSWEYVSNGGPASSKQTQVPIQIKRARYDYYYVSNDQSFGVHNAKYARYLLDVANAQLDALGAP